jgi:pyruvate carboxylase
VALRVVDERAPKTANVRPQAEAGNPGHLGASVPGIITVLVKAGDQVQAGDKVAVIEAMKMESAVTAGTSGTVDTVHVQDKAQVEPGDLVVAMTPAPPA